MLLSFSAEFRGFRRGAVVYPSLPVVSRRLAVAYPSLSRRASVVSRRASVAEPDGSKEPVPYNGMRSGPSHPRVDAGLGHVPRPSCPGGLSMDSPSPPVCGRVYGDTLAQSFAFFNGGLAGFFLDGWSCCGLRRPSAGGLAWPAPLSHRPTLRRFWVQGDSPCTPGGGCAPCTLLGEMRKAPSFHLAHRPPFLGTGGLTILPRKQRPLRPAWGRRGDRDAS